MAITLSTQLQTLQQERERLEELLMLDANWRALRELESSTANGAASREVRARLSSALRSNRIFAAREKLLETIELLSADTATGNGQLENASLSNRIVMLGAPGAEMFRARIRMKPAPAAPTAVAPNGKACGLPDALELIDGLGRHAVEQLRDDGVTRFAEIAHWTSADVRHWRTRLEGLADGTPGAWIEQAAVLAAGRLTHFAERARRGEFAALVPAPTPEQVRPEKPTPEPLASLPAHKITRPAPPVVAPAERRLVTAEELVRVLGEAVRQAPADKSREIAPSAAAPRARNGGPARGPVAAASAGADTDSEVIVIVRQPPDDAVPAAARKGHDRPRRLMERLKTTREPDRFEAEAYAAYRSGVEEASVTIIRPGVEVPGPSLSPSPTARKAPADVPRMHRFLRALTGRD